MRKGGLHKPLILDKYSADDLNSGIVRTVTQDAKLKLVNAFRVRPAISREPAGVEISQPAARGRAAKKADHQVSALKTETVKGV